MEFSLDEALAHFKDLLLTLGTNVDTKGLFEIVLTFDSTTISLEYVLSRIVSRLLYHLFLIMF